tara:strand:+ start:44 stop:208 length:165 start_codon:yes stop_codon:yes gene_type:complete
MTKIVVFLLFIIVTLISCGTTGPLFLPEGVKDKSKYKYPKEIEESCAIIESDQC